MPKNAFNLVRHYRFGELDASVKDGTAMKRLPSYKAMLKLCREDIAVRKNLIYGIRIHDANDTDDWELKLTLNDNNQIEKTGQNIKLILLHNSKLSKVRFDRFTKRDITQCPDFCNERDNRIDDESVGKICLYLENQYGLQLSQPRILEMLKTTSKERGLNPVQNFIMSDSWDYVERIDTVAIRYLGAEDTPLTRAQTRKWMIGAVARAFSPGCKFDHILTFTGPQGVGKSTFLSIIAGKWFSDLARKFDIADGDDFSRAMQMVEKLYSERENLPSQFPYSPISRPVWDFTDTCRPKDTTIGGMITHIGLSMNTVRLFSLETSLPKAKGKGSERVIAFRCGEDSDNFIAFNGKSFRQIGEPGMTVFGERRKDQVCMVYENSLDFMALMESVERNGVYPMIARRYHIILNGRKGIHEACEYMKANPDFLEVRSLCLQRKPERVCSRR